MRVAEAWSQRPAIRIVVTAALIYAYIWLCGPAPPAHADTISDYAYARTCVEGLGCSAHDTSVEGLVQGRLLIVALAGMMRLGLSPTAHHLVFIGLTTLGIVLLAELARALAGELAGLSAAALGAWAVPAAAGHPLLWNPTLASVPLALMTVACVRLAIGERPRLWALGVVLGLVGAYQGHVVHLVAWPIAGVLVGAASDDRVARGLVVFGPGLGLVVFDREILASNAQALILTPAGFTIPAAILVGVIVGGALRSRWLRVRDDRRGVVALAWIGGAILAVIGVGAWLGGLAFEARYVAAALPAVVVLAAVVPAIAGPRAQLAAGAIAALLSLRALGLAMTEAPSWTFADVEILDARLRASAGVSLGELGTSLRAPEAQALVDAARAIGPEVETRRGDDSTIRVLPIVAPSCEAVVDDPAWRCVALRRGWSAAWSRDPAPWIDPRSFEACALTEPDAAIGSCVTVDVDDPGHERRFGTPRTLTLETRGRTQRWIQRLRVRVGSEGRRRIALASGWRLRGTVGVDAEVGAQIGQHQTLWLRGQPGTEGRLVLEIEAGDSAVAPAVEAIAMELDPDEADLLELMPN